MAKTPTAGGSKAKSGGSTASAKKAVVPKSEKAPAKKPVKAAEPAKKPAPAKETKPAAKAPTPKSAPAPKKPEVVKTSAKTPEPASKPVKKTPPPLVIKDRATLAKAAAKEREREQKAAKTAELMKKTERPGLAPAAKPAAGGKGKKDAAAPGPRFQVAFADSMADGKAAAAKLSAAAGLGNLKKTKADWLVRDENAPRLKKSPLSKKQLQDFRELLVIKRAQLVGNVNAMESEALTGGGSGSLSHLPQHMADAGTDTFDQSLALDLAAQQRGVLKEIDAAIKRIDDNTFGICELVGTPIDIERLNAEPWTRYSIEAKREIERTGMPRA